MHDLAHISEEKMVRKIADHIDSRVTPVLCLIMSDLHSDVFSDIPMGPFRDLKAENKSNLGISSGKMGKIINTLW